MKVSVIGLGYVGSVAAAALASARHEVLGVDIDARRCRDLAAGKVSIYEPGLADLIEEGTTRGNLRFVHTDAVSEPLGDVIVIATGTPATESGTVDLRQVRSALAWTRARQPGEALIVMKSTVPPGTGKRLLESELKGTNLRYASNPEFLREGQAIDDWLFPDRIVVGAGDDGVVATIKAMYAGVDAPYLVTDITSAEMIKYASNAFLATKISFINEIAMLCDRLGATIDDVAKGVAMDPRMGSSFLRAGVGYGGSCFPKDIRALDQLALSNDHNFELLRSVIVVNNRQRLLPLYALRERFGSLAGVRVAILGLSFKPDTDDVRQAPALDLIDALVEEGAHVAAFDPEAIAAARRVLPSAVRLEEDLVSCAEGARAVVIMTEWPQIVDADWARLAKVTDEPRLLFDGRNALDPSVMRELGFEYKGVGRGNFRKKASQGSVAANAW